MTLIARIGWGALALLAIILLAGIGWRGMFWIGALPLVTLLPLAFLLLSGLYLFVLPYLPKGRGAARAGAQA